MSTREHSNRQEKRVAKQLGGKKTPNSGATDFVKGDVLLHDWLIECKTVMKEQSTFSVKREWIKKNKEESIAMRKHHSALVFDFGDGEDYVILDMKTFKNMLEDIKYYEESSS